MAHAAMRLDRGDELRVMTVGPAPARCGMALFDVSKFKCYAPDVGRVKDGGLLLVNTGFRLRMQQWAQAGVFTGAFVSRAHGKPRRWAGALWAHERTAGWQNRYRALLVGEQSRQSVLLAVTKKD
jgi:hypothetical protein